MSSFCHAPSCMAWGVLFRPGNGISPCSNDLSVKHDGLLLPQKCFFWGVGCKDFKAQDMRTKSPSVLLCGMSRQIPGITELGGKIETGTPFFLDGQKHGFRLRCSLEPIHYGTLPSTFNGVSIVFHGFLYVCFASRSCFTGERWAIIDGTQEGWSILLGGQKPAHL